ncbi:MULTISPECIES: DsbA family protein [unclassified Rhodococcus (in: high G+C Gram-positive bacteria)]|uniref:DsbA family oxidoreductase n=1 Tax=unclassified Rhodococcus (in: high G+C Gram-positive bacteria) TaxID=192944 RepID=UPI0016399389|nr:MULTISPECIES: DsbA family oxidoreductase [unclassified Rhodococcus (in: high G+C Gram-positive bacteria)]MBC2640910.1 DsbA family oxidoreductase [Rhodococcus sp. 3A]MBC2894347.1 DsbA family oxidoreductase [Rhodococcus sp. 4CII]
MKADVWGEVTCPWCGLGNHRIERALERFEHADEVELIHHSFPLSSSFPEGDTFSVREALLRQHGVAGSQAETSTRRIETLADSEGLSPYRVLDNKVGNTDLAHEFLAHASALGKNREAWDSIFRTYFGNGEPVFSLDDLLRLSDGLGLDREQTRQALIERRYRQQVRDDAARAQRLGATGAPFIVVDDHYGVPGAQDSDSLVELLRKAWDDNHPITPADDAGDAPVCGPDSCAVPERV